MGKRSHVEIWREGVLSEGNSKLGSLKQEWAWRGRGRVRRSECMGIGVGNKFTGANGEM